MNEKEIVRRLLERDETALEAARRAYGAYCVSLARNVTGDQRDAEECFADALNAVWNSIPPNEPEHFGAYLSKLTRNRALEMRRRETALKRGGGGFPLPLDEAALQVVAPGPEEGAVEGELIEAINRFLGSRPRRQREMFVLRYFRYERVKDIAERFDISPDSVTAALRRLKTGLEKYLKERGFEL